MSSPGCPYDNAAMENFFGTLKNECLYRAHFSTRAEVEQFVTEYVNFYHYEHINLKNGLTPFEIRSKAA
jgi:transposase InsO family protein